LVPENLKEIIIKSSFTKICSNFTALDYILFFLNILYELTNSIIKQTHFFKHHFGIDLDKVRKNYRQMKKVLRISIFFCNESK